MPVVLKYHQMANSAEMRRTRHPVYVSTKTLVNRNFLVTTNQQKKTLMSTKKNWSTLLNTANNFGEQKKNDTIIDTIHVYM